MDRLQDDLVSCLCVTRNRVELLRRAVECFQQQTHANRELVIVFDADDPLTRSYVHSILDPTILAIEVASTPRLALGAKRNLSVQVARGSYVAVWDDDDWYAPDRLRDQLFAIRKSGLPSCALQRVLLFDEVRASAYLSQRRSWENSLIARRDVMPKYPDQPQQEDTVLLDALLDGGLLAGLDRPDLYIYTHHGKNTCNRSHWSQNIVLGSTPLGEEDTQKISSVLRKDVPALGIAGRRKLLMVWEQGASLGHLVNLRLPMEVALAQGYDIVLAARELHRVNEVLGDLPLTMVQAPFLRITRPASNSPMRSFSQVLWDQCFGSERELHALLIAWRTLFVRFAPAVLMAEHAPTALLAAKGMGIPAFQIGTGFTIPPWSSLGEMPFAPFESAELSEQERQSLITYDQSLLNSVNRILNSLGSPALGHLSEMFVPPTHSFLLTYPELDHFGNRSGVKYFGTVESPPAEDPVWPVHLGAKLFVYLQCFPSVEAFLCDLQNSGANALIYIKNLPEVLKQRYGGEGMHFIDHLVDLKSVASQAQCAITHGSHNTSSVMLAAGKPQLFIPLHQEHWLFGLRLVRQGCAAMAFQDQSSYQTAIGALLNNVGLRENARSVGKKLPGYQPARLRAALSSAFAKVD